MALQSFTPKQIKSRHLVTVDPWQRETDEFKIISQWYRDYRCKSNIAGAAIPKVEMVLFQYLFEYHVFPSSILKGSHMEVLSVSDDGTQLEVLNTSESNPDDFHFRGQLCRLYPPLLPLQNYSFEVYFEKLPYRSENEQQSNNNNDDEEKGTEVWIKGTFLERLKSDGNGDGDDVVRIRIDDLRNFMMIESEQNQNQNSNPNLKSGIIEIKEHKVMKFKNDRNDDDDEEDSGYDSEDPRFSDLTQGAPFVSGEYYFIGIISNKVTTFDIDANEYHLDGFGIDNATDYVYLGEGNKVMDTNEDLSPPWDKPCILNKDVIRVDVNMVQKTLTFYKNGSRFGPDGIDYTMSFDIGYGVDNKQWFPAVAVMNKNVKACWKML